MDQIDPCQKKSTNADAAGINAETTRKFLHTPLIHSLFWCLLLVVDYCLLSMMPTPRHGLGRILLNFACVVGFFYASLAFLFPLLLQKSKAIWFVCLPILWIAIFATCKAYVSGFLFGSIVPIYRSIPQEAARNIHFLALALVYFLAVKLLDAQWKKNRAELEKAKLELSHFRMILSPHFVFNCLSTISSEYYTIAEGPSEKLAELSHLLAYGITPNTQLDNPLAQEIAQVEKFLEFQKYRFGKKLALSYSPEANTELPPGCTLPKMLLLTLVENVFKHGETHNHDFPASISYSLAKTQKGLEFTFSTKNKKSNQITHRQTRSGIGLAAIARILENSFGENASVAAKFDNDGEFVATINILYHETNQDRTDR